MFLASRAEALASAKKALDSYNKYRSGVLVDAGKLIEALTEADSLLKEFVAGDRLTFSQGLGNFQHTDLSEVVTRVISLTDLSKPAPSVDRFRLDHRILADEIDKFHGSEIDPVRRQLGSDNFEGFGNGPAFEATLLERELRDLIFQLADALLTTIEASLIGGALGVMLACDGDDEMLARATLIDFKSARRVTQIVGYELVLRTLAGNIQHLDLPE